MSNLHCVNFVRILPTICH